MSWMESYQSPLGEMLLAADEIGLVGIWFADQKHFAPLPPLPEKERETPILEQTKHWLDLYFSGQEPDSFPPIHLSGTAFQLEVWEILRTIPYGKTMTYGQIAEMLSQKHGLSRMSAQAVGGAVGRNPVSLIVPCHRVIGVGGNLVGYAGGLDRKIALLKLEQAWKHTFFIPKSAKSAPDSIEMRETH